MDLLNPPQKTVMTLTTLSRKISPEADFVKFWAGYYLPKKEHLYLKNVGKPLTGKRVMDLFIWKNGGPIAAQKLRSIKDNYLAKKPMPPTRGDKAQINDFICQSGGAIWRIFWLHCHDPVEYPIFDQHVFRAMKHIQTGKILEIGKTNKVKANQYVNEYLPFHRSFTCHDKKKLDEALWAYGKHLKSRYAIA